ncbi:MAG TPA: hypothetical protein VF145_11245, partial [Chitinophagaceae bacterium]
MKKASVLLTLTVIIATSIAFTSGSDFDRPVAIPPSEQRSGDVSRGYDYLVNGDYIRSGIPWSYFTLLNGKDKTNLLNRTGKNALLSPEFTAVTTANGIDIVTPNCLQCHAQVFGSRLILGLGNTFIDFSTITGNNNFRNRMALKVMEAVSPKEY